MPEPERQRLRAARRGEVALAEVVAAIDDAERQLVTLSTDSSVHDEPDRAWVDDWLHRSYLSYWSSLDR